MVIDFSSAAAADKLLDYCRGGADAYKYFTAGAYSRHGTGESAGVEKRRCSNPPICP